MEKLLTESVWTKIIQIINPEKINEIRIRIHRPIQLKAYEREYYIDFIPDEKYIENVIAVATNHSRYAHEQELSDGYLTYGNGIRIGIAGRGKENDKNEIIYSRILSICIRIPRKITFDHLSILTEQYRNTLIIGPPYSGKTTYIRAISEQLSDRYDICVIDERLEIAGNDLTLLSGKKVDLIQGVKKEKIYEKIIRSLAPQIIVCDELFDEKDFLSVNRIMSSGILCLASFHAAGKKDVPKMLLDCFDVLLVLSSKPKVGSILSIERKND